MAATLLAAAASLAVGEAQLEPSSIDPPAPGGANSPAISPCLENPLFLGFHAEAQRRRGGRKRRGESQAKAQRTQKNGGSAREFAGRPVLGEEGEGNPFSLIRHTRCLGMAKRSTPLQKKRRNAFQQDWKERSALDLIAGFQIKKGSVVADIGAGRGEW